jgi:hypothetical protein
MANTCRLSIVILCFEYLTPYKLILILAETCILRWSGYIGTIVMNLTNIVKRGWEYLGKGDFDTLVKDYVEGMIFIMPGQTDLLEGRQGFRSALDSLGSILPPGFEITEIRHLEGEGEVVSILEWKSDKVGASQLSVLFKFKELKICEERWFLDTEQWKSAF